MQLMQLRYFIAIVDKHSFTEAARECFVTQPNLSQHMRALEKELNVPLFIRHGRSFEVTPAGKLLYQQCEQMFQSLRMMADSVRDVDAGLRGQVKLGVIYSDIPVVMEHWKAYHRLYPQVELYIRMGTPDDLLDDLSRGKLHALYLRSQSEEPSGLREKILGEDRLELVMNGQTDPAPGQDSVPIQALEGVPMCLLRSDDLWGYSNHLRNQCQRAGFSLNVVCQCYDTPMAMQLVQAGFGVSYLPRSIVQTLPTDSGVYSKPVQGLTARSYPVLVWADNLYYAACVKRYLALAGGVGESGEEPVSLPGAKGLF